MATAIELLTGAKGERSIWGLIGKWRLYISKQVDALVASGGGTGGTKTYANAEMSSGGAGQTLGPATDVKFNTSNGDIPYAPATGLFTLAANKRYKLTGHFALSSYSGETINLGIEWVTSANTVVRDGHGAFLTSGGNTNSLNVQPTAEVIIETTAATQVKLRVTSAGGTATALPGVGTYATVEEL